MRCPVSSPVSICSQTAQPLAMKQPLKAGINKRSIVLDVRPHGSCAAPCSVLGWFEVRVTTMDKEVVGDIFGLMWQMA